MGAEKAHCPAKAMARVLRVSRSGFHGWLAKGGPEGPWAGAREVVRRVWLESDRRLGARSALASLPDELSGATLYRVRRCARELGVRGIAPNARERAAVPDEGAPARPDLIRRDFASPAPTCKLAGGMTCLRAGGGRLCLATVIDLCARTVAGWAISERMTADIVVSALESARARGCVAESAAFHSDRGARRASRLPARWAGEHHVRLSAGRAGSCRDDAVAESFFGALKNETHHLGRWPTRAEARNAAIACIEGFYDRRRPRSAIGCRIPAEEMEAFFRRAAENAAAAEETLGYGRMAA